MKIEIAVYSGNLENELKDIFQNQIKVNKHSANMFSLGQRIKPVIGIFKVISPF